MTPGEYLRNAALADVKHSTIYDKFKNYKKPNVFYYMPSIFMQGNSKLLSNPNKYIALSQTIMDKVKQNKPLTIKEMRDYAYQGVDIYNDTNIWQLDLEIHMFDDQATAILDRKINNLKFGHLFTNKSYVVPYFIGKGHKRYYGASVPFPKLVGNHTYMLEIIEHWRVKVPISKTKDTLGSFTRRVLVPINPNKEQRPYNFKWDIGKISQIKKLHMAPFFRNDLISGINRYFDKQYINSQIPSKDLTTIGQQSIFVNMIAMPQIIFDYYLGACDRFYGNPIDISKSIQNKLNSVNGHFNKAATNLLKHELVNYSSGQLIAAQINAKVNVKNHKLEYNHNGWGAALVNMQYIINKKGRRYSSLYGLPNQIYSRYDLEERLPRFYVNA